MWMTSGDGTFSDPAILNPVYTHGTTDLENGGAVLTLIGYSAQPCADALSEMLFTILPAPSAMIEGDTTICAGEPVVIAVDLTGAAPWVVEIEGYGTVNATDSPLLIQVTPAQSIVYQVTAVTDGNNCSAAGSGTFTINVNPLPYLYLVPDTMACNNHVVTLTAETEGDVSYLWTPGDFTTRSIQVDTTGIGTGTHSWSVLVTDANACVSNATANVTFNDCTGLDAIYSGNIGVFPNPSNGEFAVRFLKTPKVPVSITLTDNSGRMVYSDGSVVVTGRELRLNIPSLSSGVYLLNVTEGKDTSSQRVIISR
jgi:hypothetical protein